LRKERRENGEENPSEGEKGEERRGRTWQKLMNQMKKNENPYIMEYKEAKTGV